MSSRSAAIFRISGLVVAVVVVVGISAAAMPRVKEWFKARAGEGEPGEKRASSVELVGANGIHFLSPAAALALGVQTAEALKVTKPRLLELPGSLGPNIDRLLPVRSRFAGEVMELGEVADPEAPRPTKFRPVQTGDQVHEGQLLAVVWCKDLGQYKSQLVDALSKLRLDEETLKKLTKLYYEDRAIPEVSLNNGKRNVEQDKIAVSAAERTLRTYRLTDKEIQGIYDEAERLAKRVNKGEVKIPDMVKDKDWARVDVWAPFDGTILEKNICPGAIVDTTSPLFIVSDLRHLGVVAYPYEEVMPVIQALPRPIHWKIHLANNPTARPLKGTIQEIRPLIDPNMHTGLIKGLVDNPEGKLLQGQFVTATIEVPPALDEIEIPSSALVEDGQESIVFVQSDAKFDLYTLRRVVVVRRSRDLVYLRSRLTAKQESQGLMPVRSGERVVTAGALEMRAALSDLQDSVKTAASK